MPRAPSTALHLSVTARRLRPKPSCKHSQRPACMLTRRQLCCATAMPGCGGCSARRWDATVVLDWWHVAVRFEHALQTARGLGVGIADGQQLADEAVGAI